VEEIWGEKTWRQAEKDSYFNDGRFVGTSPNSLIQLNADLSKQKGDRINTPLRARLISDGKVDDAAIEGQEKALVFLDGEMTEQRTKIRMRSEAKDALGLWLAESRDTDVLMGLSGLANGAGTIAAVAPTANRKFYGGQKSDGSTGVETAAGDEFIDNTGGRHLFGTLVISHLKRMARKDGGASYGKLRPLNIGGKDWYVMFVSPWQLKALRADNAWLNAQKDANIRGHENPIFSGAAGIWDGVILHEYDKIIDKTGNGLDEEFEAGDTIANGITVARALFCGAQAGVLAYGRKIGWQEKVFEYDSQFGVEISSIYGFSKSQFNSEDFGVITCDTRVDLDA
jgi:N4-gp56 family major capsid protein